MGRVARSDLPGTWFHVVNRGAARADIFFADRDRVEFGRLLGEAHDRWGIQIHAYCLMSNHYHLLVEGPNEALSHAMHHVGGVYARHLNDRIGRDGPVFRGRFFSRPVLTEPYLIRVVRYIHLNPAAIVGMPMLESYRWSSYRTYLGHRQAPHWMTLEVISNMADGADGMRTLVEGSLSDVSAVGASDLRAAVDLMVDEYIDAPSQSVARTVLALVARDSDAEIADLAATLLALPSRAAVSSAKSRAKRRAEENPELRRAADHVVRLVA